MSPNAKTSLKSTSGDEFIGVALAPEIDWIVILRDVSNSAENSKLPSLDSMISPRPMLLGFSVLQTISCEWRHDIHDAIP